SGAAKDTTPPSRLGFIAHVFQAPVIAGVFCSPAAGDIMPNWISRLLGGGANVPAERKAFAGHTLLSLSQLGAASWSQRGFASLVNQGFAKNPVVYRCVRLIAETANRVPL